MQRFLYAPTGVYARLTAAAHAAALGGDEDDPSGGEDHPSRVRMDGWGTMSIECDWEGARE